MHQFVYPASSRTFVLIYLDKTFFINSVEYSELEYAVHCLPSRLECSGSVLGRLLIWSWYLRIDRCSSPCFSLSILSMLFFSLIALPDSPSPCLYWTLLNLYFFIIVILAFFPRMLAVISLTLSLIT